MTITLSDGNGRSGTLNLKAWHAFVSLCIALTTLFGSVAGAASWVASRTVHEWYDTSGSVLVEKSIDTKIMQHNAEAELRSERLFNQLLVEIERLKTLMQQE